MTIAAGALEQAPASTVAPLATGARSWARRLYPPAFVLAGVTGWLLWTGVSSTEQHGSLGPVLAAGRAELVAPMVLAVVAVTLVCERCWPAERREVFARGHLHDAAFFILHVVAVVPLMTLLGVAFAYLLGRHAGWIEAPWTASWPRWLLLAVTLVLMDGANWLAHWADHRFALLWRMHAVHHTQEELSVLTSFRAHPLSHLPGFFLATIPVIALMGDRGMAPALITGYVCLGTLPHANLPWSLGPLGRVVVSPAYHRRHHSVEGPDGCNLGVVLTVWDVLAGRARFPAKGAPTCRTGLAGRARRTEQNAGDRWHIGVLFTQLAEPFGIDSSADRGDRAATNLVRRGTAPPAAQGAVHTSTTLRIPWRQSTRHGPVIPRRLAGSEIIPRWDPVDSTTSTSAGRPVSSLMYVDHCWMLTISSPPQFTMVAGTLAAANSGSTCSLMSSWKMGVYGQGSHRAAIGMPASTASRLRVSSPPLGP
jgi:sterol desaturase/sphingolipid hydroxylase (fatty acid hydroxylase superfamily)